MDQASTLYSLQVIWDSDSDTEVSSVNKQTDATGLDHEKTTSTLHRLQIILDADNDIENSSLDKQTETTRSDHKQTFQGNKDEAKATSNQQAELTITNEKPMEQNIIYQRGEKTKESEMDLEPQNEERDESSGEKNDKPADPSVSTETTEQEGEDQTLQTKPDQEQGEEDEHEVFQEQVEPHINVVFIETSDEPAIEDLLKNCQKYEDELRMGEILKGAAEEYKTLLKNAKETGFQKQKIIPPPSELNSVNAKERKQAPLLYTVIAFVSEKVPNYKRWREAVSEFIILTTLSQSEPPSSQKKRSNSKSGYQNKSKPPAKSYHNSIEKLLDQDWGPDRAPGPSVYNDYRHLFTCESVLRSTFPEADIFSLVDSTIRGPEDVPPELRHKALFHFLLSFNRKKYGVEPSDAWRDFGRLVLAEKQLDLARKAQGPDKMQNELKEKTEEVEELSTRLSKYESKQLTEEKPNIADLSDTHRPTRLGEMYSQLFDDEWSEAFEAFKPKTEDEDDDIFPDTLYILQDLLMNIFEFCQDHSKCQKIYLEESFAKAIALQTLKENYDRAPNEKSKRSVRVENKMYDTNNSSNKIHELETEDDSANSSVYEKTIARFQRDFRRAASSASVKNITELFIATELPALIADETVRADVRVLTYVRKCVELCWYMCMQDPPMVIISPKQGQLVDKALFSFHGRRGKIVEVCVWPALLLNENGPLVCKGYVLPEERNRNR